MAEKALTEAAWNTFAKGASYKDAALVKALAAFDKSERNGPQAELDALDDLEKQADLLRKANKSDKKLGDYLDTLDKALAKQRKQSQAALEEAKKAAEDDEESPALLTTKMVPLLREVRKGELTLQALVAVAGKETVVLLSRRAISPARGKLLKEQMENPNGLKFVKGTCIYENNAVTFVVQAQASGLAKRLKAALLAQTELRLKVRVRGEDPDDVEEDGEEEIDPNATQQTATTEPKTQEPDPLQERYEQRMQALEPRIVQALRNPAGDTSKLRALTAFAREKAEARTYGAALQALEAIDKLLATFATPSTQPSEDPKVNPSTAFKARLVALLPKLKQVIAQGGPAAVELKRRIDEAGELAQKRDFDRAHALLDEAENMAGGSSGESPSDAPTQPEGGGAKRPSLVQQRVFMLTRWRQIPAELKVELQSLQQAIASSGADSDPDELVEQLSGYMDELVEDLQEEMDDAINAGDTGAFKGLVDRVANDDVIKLLVSNPFIKGTTFRDTLLKAMREIEAGLAG